ncbi:MAG: zf-HC2 domain-containing protein [Acidobacteriia bacterium]|nr:zf-HC2 domain-containing protein [Terriglobia bacterium]
MTEHESVRAMLALAAAGALEPKEQRRVDQHARECDLCRKDLETWAAYAQSLRKLPQPAAPEGMAQRTQALILQHRAETTSRRRNELFLGALAMFGWGAGWAFWTLVRAIVGGNLNVFGANLLNGLTWSLMSMVVAGITAATAASMLGKGKEARRFL